MKTTVNERLNLMVEHFEKGKKSAFARAIGLSPQGVQSMLTGRQSEPSFEVLSKILLAYPQVHTEWLVLGQGEMLKGQQSETAGLEAGAAVVAESETLLKLAVTEAKLEAAEKQLVDKEKLIDRLWNMIPAKLGKMLSSLEAAGLLAGAGREVSALQTA